MLSDIYLSESPKNIHFPKISESVYVCVYIGSKARRMKGGAPPGLGVYLELELQMFLYIETMYRANLQIRGM